MNRLLLLFLPLFLSAQSSNDAAIRSLQDRRTSHIDSLTVFLRSEESRERASALLALANIQDTASLEQVTPLLNDREPSVRAMAAFSTGMIGKPKGTNALFKRLAVEREAKVIAALFNAIGMSGTPDDLRRIISQTENYRMQWKPYIAQSVYRFANRRIKDPAATKYAVTLLDDPASILNAAYALMRINDTLIIRNNAERLLRLLNNTSPLVRMWGSTILGSLDDEATFRRLKAAAKNDKDWRVRVNAVRAIRLKPSAARDLIGLLSDPNEHVALTAADAYEVLTSVEERGIDSLSLFSALRSPKVVPSVKDALRRIIAKRLGERALPLIGDWKTGQPYSSAQRIRAYGDTRSINALTAVKEALRTSTHSLAVIAALEAYQTIAKDAGGDVQKDFLKSAALLFQKNDAGISTAAAAAFQDTAFPAGIRSIFRSALVTAYMGMRAPADLEPMVELLNVFAQIGDSTVLSAVMKGRMEKDKVIRDAAEKAYTAIAGDAEPDQDLITEQPYQPFYTTADLHKIAQYTGAEIITSKGTVRITFDTEAAPFTVLNFILLSEKKFYDGLSFHRVVSNFVVQGGDPLGNGSGGPDYSIRTEVHPATLYRTGAVGMASSGKDTEGSQWFITHCPTPHLDFRYTIFAYTRDLAVVDKIMIGDRIERITLIR